MVQHLLRGIWKECRIYWPSSIRPVNDVRPHRIWAGRTYATKYGKPRNKVRRMKPIPCRGGFPLLLPSPAFPVEIGHMGIAGTGWGHHGQGRRDAC
jgi:hypothetical protein